MADRTIGALPTATSVQSDDLFVLQQSGVAKNLRGEYFLQAVSDRAELVVDAMAEEVADDIKTHVTVSVTSLPQGEQPTVTVMTDAGGNLRFVFGIPAASGEGAQSVDGVFADMSGNVSLNALRSSSQELTGAVIEDGETGGVIVTGEKGQVFSNLGLGTMALLNYGIDI